MEQLAPCCLDGGVGVDGDNRPPGVGQLGQGSFVFRGLLDGSSEPSSREGVGVEDKSESSNAVSSQVHEIRDVSRGSRWLGRQFLGRIRPPHQE